MPFFVPDQQQADFRLPTYAPPQDQPPPDESALAAAFRQDNTVVNLMRAASERAFPPDPNHNPLDIIGGTRFEEQYLGSFIDSRSEVQTRSIMAKIEGEERDRRTLDASGFGGMVLQGVAGLLDPTILLPGGSVVRAARGGFSAARSAASIGAITAAQVAGQEAVLQSTQESRPLSDSAMAVASGTILGGLIGAGAARLLSRVERVRLERGMDEYRAGIGEGGASLPPVAAGDAPLPAGAAVVGEEKHGPVLGGFEGTDGARWREAVDWLRANGGGEVPGALHHPEIGDIDLVWGQYDPARPKDGYGLAKIIGKHPEMVDNLGDILSNGEIVSRSGNRIRVADQQHMSVVSLDWYGEAKTWLVTSYEPDSLRAGGRMESPGGLQGDSHSSSPSRAVDTIAQPPVEGNAGSFGASGGAAISDSRRLELVRSGITDIPVFGRLIENTSPTMRVMSGPFRSARRAMADLAETALEFVDNAAGIPTTRGATLDRLSRLQVAQARVAVADEMDRLFSDMRFKGQVALPGVRAWGERLFGRDAEITGIPRTMEEFRREVGRAMRRGDQHPVAQVAAAAQFVRTRVFEPWKQRAIEAKLLPEGVDVKTADSYFQRVYDKPKINAQRPQFEQRITDYLRADQEANQRTQTWLQDVWTAKQRLDQQIGKIEGRIATADKRAADLSSRLNERSMEVRRAEQRADVLGDRLALAQEQVAELEDFIREMRDVASDPTTRELIDQMEAELVDLRRADRPPTEAQLRQAEADEIKGILSGDNRAAAEIVVGRRKPYKAPSFLSWIVRGGGIEDGGGDVLAALGGDVRTRPGLVSGNGADADTWAERIMEASRGRLTERPEPNDVLNWIADATRGKDPDWWVDTRVDVQKQQVTELADAWSEVFGRAGIEPKTVADVGKVLRDERIASGADLVTLDDLDRIAGELEAAGEGVPVQARREQVEGDLFVQKEALAQVRQQIADARAARDRARGRERVAAGREGEAGIAARANRGRLGILNDRMDTLERQRAILDTVLEANLSLREQNRRQIEEAIGQWRGQSSAEAMAALRRVAELTAERAPDAPRLRSADRAVDRAVKRILQAQKDLDDTELRDQAAQIIDNIIGTPDGRLPYDLGSKTSGASDGARGPLARRVFNIPDEMIEDWLVDDVEEVVGTHLRTVVPDVLLAEKFGDADMTMAFRGLADEHAALTREAGSEKERLALRKQYDAAVRDLAAVRDRIKGTFGFSTQTTMRNLGRAAQAVRAFNTITMMGGAAISSISDAAGAVFRHGLGTVLQDAWLPFARHLATGLPKEGAVAQARQQYRAMGIAAEMALGQRHQSIDEIATVYKPTSRFERTLSWGADRFQLLNLLAPWTDMQKTMAAVVSGNEVLRATKAAAAGKATARQIKNLAAAGIDQQLAGSIWREFSAAGEVIDGVHLPNTGDWASREAREAFEAAVAREVDIAVITPGQEKPLWMSDPILATFGQFKAFTAAATERVLIANLQRHDAQALQGLVTSVALGALSYGAYSLASGQDVSKRPQDWIKEGVSRAGLLGWLEEGNALAAKATRGSVDIYRTIGADKPLSRYASRTVLSQLLGPTAGRVEALTQTTGSAFAGEWSVADTRRSRSFIAMQNLFYLRRGFDAVESGLNDALGVPQRRQ